MKTLLLFSPKPSFLFEEAGININSKGPHGNLDILLISQGSQYSSSHTGFLVLGKTSTIAHAASIAKMETTFGTPASG